MAFPFKTIATLWLVLTTSLSSLPVQPDNQARLYLQNVPLQDERLLVVNMLLADVADLYGAEIQLRYDPTQLAVRDDNPRLEGIQITPGPLLAFEDRFVVQNAADGQAGLVNFVFTLLNPAPPISGEGVLATIVFEISGSGPFSVEVVEAQLVSSELEPVPVTTEGLFLSGDLEPTVLPQQQVEPAPAQQFGISTLPAWQWVGIIVGLSLFGVLVLLVLLRLRWVVATEPDRTQPMARRMPASTRSSIRSATLLTKQGNHALSQGDIQKAYELFSRAIELDPANAEAWLGKGLVAQQETEKRICFQRVLAFDPTNATAKTGLQQLKDR